MARWWWICFFRRKNVCSVPITVKMITLCSKVSKCLCNYGFGSSMQEKRTTTYFFWKGSQRQRRILPKWSSQVGIAASLSKIIRKWLLLFSVRWIGSPSVQTWNYMLENLKEYNIIGLDHLKKVLIKIRNGMPMAYVHGACTSFKKRLLLVKKTNGGIMRKNLL